MKIWNIRSYWVPLHSQIRDLAQLVAHTSGGREVASSSLVIPTTHISLDYQLITTAIKAFFMPLF